MLASGNSEVAPCCSVLLAATQREIPFARSKGMDPDIYDMPFDEAESYLDESARDVLGAYEPRVDVEEVELEFGEGDGSGAAFTVSVSDASAEGGGNDDWGDG